jgi:hypothetical protein
MAFAFAAPAIQGQLATINSTEVFRQSRSTNEFEPSSDDDEIFDCKRSLIVSHYYI